MASFLAIDAVGVTDVEEVSLAGVLQLLPCSRKQMASDLVPVQEAPGCELAYDWAGKDV